MGWELINDVTLLILGVLAFDDLKSAKAMMCVDKYFSGFDLEELWRSFLINHFDKSHLDLPVFERNSLGPNDTYKARYKRLIEIKEEALDLNCSHDNMLYSATTAMDLDVLHYLIPKVKDLCAVVSSVTWYRMQEAFGVEVMSRFFIDTIKLLIQHNKPETVSCMDFTACRYDIAEYFTLVLNHPPSKALILSEENLCLILTEHNRVSPRIIDLLLKEVPWLVECSWFPKAYFYIWRELGIKSAPTPRMIFVARNLGMIPTDATLWLLEFALSKHYSRSTLDALWEIGYRVDDQFLCSYKLSRTQKSWLRSKGYV